MDEISKLLLKRELTPTPSFKSDFGRTSYHIQSLKKTGELRGHRECVNTINFNPNGSLLVTGSDDESVKIWDFETRTCLETLYGHTTNVFAANFLPHKADREIISGGNDGDVRHYDLVSRTCTVYHHHQMKVLKISVNPRSPDTYLTCSGDGTVRMFDSRQKYPNSTSETMHTTPSGQRNGILPQLFGGGRSQSSQTTTTTTTAPTSRPPASFSSTQNYGSLLMDFNSGVPLRRSLRLSITLPDISVFCVEFHPTDGYSFITALSDGTVRLFDLRNIKEISGSSFVNIYRNLDLPWPSQAEATGCVFNKDGSEILATYLSDLIYLFDVNKNYSKEYSLDYFKDYSAKPKKRRAIHHHGKRKKMSKHKQSNSTDVNIDLSRTNSDIGHANTKNTKNTTSNDSDGQSENESSAIPQSMTDNISLRSTQTNLMVVNSPHDDSKNKNNSKNDDNIPINVSRDSKSEQESIGEENTNREEDEEEENQVSEQEEENEEDNDDDDDSSEQVSISYDNLMAIDFYEEIMRQYNDQMDDDQDSYYDEDDEDERSDSYFDNDTENDTYSFDSDDNDYEEYNRNNDDTGIEDDDDYHLFTFGSSSNYITSSNSSSNSMSSNNSGLYSQSYMAKYDGHISVATIKSCNFYGPNSEYVVSGSDDHMVYIWDKQTTKLLRVLKGHEDCVNSIIQHPTEPTLVTAGIDSEAFIWEPEGQYPTRAKFEKRDENIKYLQRSKEKRTKLLNETTDSLIATQCAQQ